MKEKKRKPKFKLSDTAGDLWPALPGAMDLENMTQEEFAARRDEAGSFTRKQWATYIRHEKMIIERLRDKSLSKENRQHLKDALDSIRKSLFTTRRMFSEWGITLRDPDQAQEMNGGRD